MSPFCVGENGVSQALSPHTCRHDAHLPCSRDLHLSRWRSFCCLCALGVPFLSTCRFRSPDCVREGTLRERCSVLFPDALLLRSWNKGRVSLSCGSSIPLQVSRVLWEPPWPRSFVRACYVSELNMMIFVTYFPIYNF